MDDSVCLLLSDTRSTHSRPGIEKLKRWISIFVSNEIQNDSSWENIVRDAMENGKILFSNGLECVNRGMSVMLSIEKYDIRELLLVQRYNVSGNINTIEKAIRNDISRYKAKEFRVLVSNVIDRRMSRMSMREWNNLINFWTEYSLESVLARIKHRKASNVNLTKPAVRHLIAIPSNVLTMRLFYSA